jgi:hypothetical protein
VSETLSLSTTHTPQSHKAIHAEQQRTTQRATTHLLYQTRYQVPIAMGTHHASQPKTCGHLKRHCQPGYPPLMLHPYLISLNLTQVTGLLHQVFMNLLTVLPCTALPGSHCAFIQPKGSYNCSYGTAISQKRYHLSHKSHRVSKTVKHCAFALCKRLAADTADVAPLLAAVNTDVATTNLASCRTVWTVAEFLTGIHKLTPFVFWFSKRMSVDPLFVNLYLSPHFNAGLPNCKLWEL